MQEYHGDLTLKINTMKATNKFKPKFKDVILQLLFTFNIFESEFFEEPKWIDSSKKKCEFKFVRERINEIQNHCNINNYSVDLLESFQSHFSLTYIEEKAWTDRFRLLEKSDSNKTGFDPNEMKDLYNFLTEPLSKNREKAIKYALILSYVFRNNLFHGYKDIRHLEIYDDDFKEITTFLSDLMIYLNKTGANKF